MNLKNLNAYEILQERPLEDIHSEGYYLLHKKSGAKVVVVSNEDENKVFYIGFRTPPKDSTGVPHIIEHTVLCGSEKFPAKDPFIELVKGSMNTFLNAMTYPDKTVYPVASCNDKDFQNLMDVYMDAVLHPNIYKEQNIFRQEGWHYEMDSPEDDLTINGVVYNEMKGAYSVADSVVERSIQTSLYPDTPYRYDSGGDPEVIPELTYEQYLAFHRSYYHPSNSYIYLYGNMDVEEKLNWLDQAYLSEYDRTDPGSEIPLQPTFAQPVCEDSFYSISSAENERDNTYLCYNWSVGTSLDPEQYIAFDILGYALLTSNGAPVRQALIDAGIGDDIYGGYDGGIFQPYFSVIAKNANPEDRDRFCEVIREVLSAQAQNGINRTTLLAAVNRAEFKFREADFGRFPKGLMFGLQMMDSWLYDDAQPFLHMDEIHIYQELREKIPAGYFEELVQTCLLDNPHASILRVMPKKGLNAERDQALQEKLNAYRDSLGESEIQALIRDTEDLAAYQEEPSSREDLDKIPLLSRDDMKKVSDPYSNIVEEMGGIPYLWHDYDTNGIVYLDLLFDANHIPEAQVPYLQILCTLLGRLDTEDYSFLDLTNEIYLYTGGVHAETNVSAVVAGDREYEAKLEIRMRTLESNLTKTIELAKSMMLRTLFTDEKRICELLAETKSRLQTQLRESGNSVAAGRVLSYSSRRARYNELLHGIAQYRVLENLVADYENRKEELQSILKGLIASLMQPSNLVVSCTGSRSGFDMVQNHADQIREGLYADEEKTDAGIALPEQVNEGFMDASQIQYVALAGNFKKAGLPYTGALRVFRCIMNYEYLWQNIRVRGGAYGCGCSAGRTGDIYFSSYRDPNLGRTLEVYRGVTEYLKNFDVEERDMTRYVIGTFSEMDAPLTPAGMGRRSLQAWMNGTSYEMIQRERDEVLNAGCQSIRDLAKLLEAVISDAYVCAIGNEETLRRESDLFETLETL
ncbi:MAG: insulinase family protein [Clostridiales bacterium]|nr:insulinase family protein [Clostridiales bacterium]